MSWRMYGNAESPIGGPELSRESAGVFPGTQWQAGTACQEGSGQEACACQENPEEGRRQEEPRRQEELSQGVIMASNGNNGGVTPLPDRKAAKKAAPAKAEPRGRHRNSDRNTVGNGIVPNTGRHAAPEDGTKK